MKKLFICTLLIHLFLILQLVQKTIFLTKQRACMIKKKFEDSKFLFQRNIVFNPKDAKSYLFLAKIYKSEENERKEIKYLKTTLLLEPDNEDALYMLIDIKLKNSNFSEVKDLTKKFKIVCSILCDKTKSIDERLKNIEAKDESKQ